MANEVSTRKALPASVDVPAVVGTVLIWTVLVAYLNVMADQGDSRVAWFTGGLAVTGTASAYGVWRAGPGRRVALIASACLLLPLGILAMFSVGLPLVVAAALLAGAAGRS